MQRIILHLDLDAFYCAVEEKSNPSLIGMPFAVGGDADKRGVVASCSYAARMHGVRSAMPMATARRLCPGLIIVPHDFIAYHNYSHQVMDILHDLTPLVEKLSIDEAFLDVTGLSDDGYQLAKNLQLTIRSALGLPVSLGVATNKLTAKTANTMGKQRHQSPEPPCRIEVVPPGQEAAYLAPLPIRELWGIGTKTAESLNKLGIYTIGDIAEQRDSFMIYHFGKNGYEFWRRSQGIDNRTVEPYQETKSISKEITFTADLADAQELRRVLRHLSEQVGRRARQSELSGKTIHIKLRWEDFTTLTRQTTLPHPTQDDEVIIAAALALFQDNWPHARPVRLIGVGISNFEQAPQQLELWTTEETKRKRDLQNTLDTLKQRFGDHSVQRAINIKKAPDEK